VISDVSPQINVLTLGNYQRKKISEMKITIDRTYEEKQTKGYAAIFDAEGTVIFTFDTLELPWKNNEPQISCIPEGKYKVVRRFSQKYKDHMHVTDVEGRSFILIHWGNYAGSANPKTGIPDIKGCILIGNGFKDITGDGIDEILRSKTTFQSFMAIMPQEITLEICGNNGKYSPEGK
jgi:hypothetical protein